MPCQRFERGLKWPWGGAGDLDFTGIRFAKNDASEARTEATAREIRS
jgi:hypothetical protein